LFFANVGETHICEPIVGAAMHARWGRAEERRLPSDKKCNLDSWPPSPRLGKSWAEIVLFLHPLWANGPVHPSIAYTTHLLKHPMLEMIIT
jgi:hypothetical protein